MVESHDRCRIGERRVQAMTVPGRPTVAVVICAYTEDRWNEMMASVGSATSQTHHAAEIILVIDHNPALLRRATFELPSVRVIPNSNEKGLSGARNTGIAAATSEIIAFLDDDAFAATNWLAALVAPYADPDVIGVGGQAIPQWRSGRPEWFPPEFDWVVGCTHPGMPHERTPVRNLTAANMSLRRELLLECGGFDSGLDRIGTPPTGSEKADLCIRVQRLHPEGSFLYEPKAVVRQGVPAYHATWSHFRSQCFSEGLSKAVDGNLVGATHALSAVQSYMHSVTPHGVIRSIAEALRGDPTAVRAALAFCAGVAITGAGYVIGARRLASYGLARRRHVTSPGVRRRAEQRMTSAARGALSVSCVPPANSTRMILQNKEIHL
jgi:hypothetical protein